MELPPLLSRSWDHYRANLLPKELHPQTVAALRHAFYAGALIVHTTMLNISEHRISEDHAVVLLMTIGREIDAVLAEYAAATGQES